MLIQDLLAIAREQEIPLYNLSVYENGAVQTVQPTEANDVCPVYSISKNFAATAVGILVTRGTLRLTDTVYDILHESHPALCGEDWKHVTLSHALSQTTGIDRGMLDIDADRTKDYGTEDYLAICLRAPLVHKPGQVFLYSDSHFYFACRLVAAACGQRAQDLLNDALFRPLRFQGHAIAVCPHGHAIGGSGMFFRTVDLVKLGRLYLQDGVWEDKRILSEAWCRAATSPQIPSGLYGYSFWLTPGKSCFHGSGLHGQTLFVSRETDTVAAWTCHDRHGISGALMTHLRALEP